MSKMICLCGLPGSGKTHWSQKFLKDHPDFRYFCPDDYHARINGSECDRSNVFEVWMAMFRDIHIAEEKGQNVLIDSDNLTFAQRMQWVEWFPNFEVRELKFFMPNFDLCLERVDNRVRKVPYKVMLAKYQKWENPKLNDDIKYWDKVEAIAE